MQNNQQNSFKRNTRKIIEIGSYIVSSASLGFGGGLSLGTVEFVSGVATMGMPCIVPIVYTISFGYGAYKYRSSKSDVPDPVVDNKKEKEEAVKKTANEKIVKSDIFINNNEKQLPDGLKFMPVPGNGHCLYNAVALYLGQDVSSLRDRVAGKLEDNINEYQQFITLPEGVNIKNYIQNIRNGNEWGGDLEITILSRSLKRPIVAVGPNYQIINKQILDIELDNNEGPIFVYYNGINHYDGLILKKNFDGKRIVDDLLQRSQYQTTESVNPRSKEDARYRSYNTFIMNKLKSNIQVLQSLYIFPKARLNISEAGLGAAAMVIGGCLFAEGYREECKPFLGLGAYVLYNKISKSTEKAIDKITEGIVHTLEKRGFPGIQGTIAVNMQPDAVRTIEINNGGLVGNRFRVF